MRSHCSFVSHLVGTDDRIRASSELSSGPRATQQKDHPEQSISDSYLSLSLSLSLSLRLIWTVGVSKIIYLLLVLLLHIFVLSVMYSFLLSSSLSSSSSSSSFSSTHHSVRYILYNMNYIIYII